MKKARKGLTTIQIGKETAAKLRGMGKKNESYDRIIHRMEDNPYGFDEGIYRQLNSISAQMGIDKKTLMLFGAMAVIFLASSGTLQQLQQMAMSKNKPLFTVFLELLKKLGRIGGI